MRYTPFISSLLLLGIALSFQIQGQTNNKQPQQKESKNPIENYLRHSDDWEIVIDSAAIRISEKEKKNNIVFSLTPEIKINTPAMNSGQKKDKRIIVKTSLKNNKNNGGFPTDSITHTATHTVSYDSITNPTSSSETLNYDTSRTINYDDSRTINVDNNRDINKGRHMNKNRDRERDWRRDLKRDKSRDRGRDSKRDKGRDMKRDKNRDRIRKENTGNRLKIKIYY